ncbi:unnamed protein product [Paramecium sonneborni]|uniref:Uncharacterized protein n=1 Tax=Paramecium sonneborni TaxID=65129 RepID=A0A8S1NN08_9CILI|nr:unnamed protein product [Paramecium sonneborni]
MLELLNKLVWDLVLIIELKLLQQLTDLIFQILLCYDLEGQIEKLNSHYLMKKLERNILIHKDFVEGIAVVQAKKKGSLNYYA